MERLAPVGRYLALRVGFAFPLEEINELPPDWVEHYTRERFMLFDPVIRWCYQNAGAIRWSEIGIVDSHDVLLQAHAYGLRFGAAVAVRDEGDSGQRSFGSFLRSDREYTDAELDVLLAYVKMRHDGHKPPTNLTRAELEVLGMVKDGQRLKQIAHALGVSEGAIKQRLRSARGKLKAATSTQAAALASGFGLI